MPAALILMWLHSAKHTFPMKEVYGGEYTFFWKGLAFSEPRRSVVGFAVKNYLATQLIEYVVHVSDHITKLSLYMERENYLNVISAYAPTLDKSDENKLYEETGQILRRIDAVHRSYLRLL
ncbi:unnamed protein product [Parnassius apollo]|uniref:(apollo) hypothetical protein n=1 Tax=Parnassius apollo TaxID=110799 RepID=A0A8S3YA90_PARAO|nr:unnamed protein product [Parnassius apollo]